MARNREAYHEYFVEEEFEAGIELVGTEVKSIRAGTLNLKDAWCGIKDGEMILNQMHISPYDHGNRFNVDSRRPRRLLMHKREIILRQKQEGGLVCVVSHSHLDNILRDYRAHFGLEPDAVYGWELPPHQRKPNTYPLEDIMTRYHLKPEEILVVDDMKLACQMAEPLGVRVAYSGWNGLDISEIDEEMRSICGCSFDSTEKLYNFLFD